jgi:LCP family protein required for cell wall assembly
VRVALAVLVLLLVGGAVAVALVDRSLDRQVIDGLATPGDGDEDGEDAAPGGLELPDDIDQVLNVLVTGSDDRSVLTPDERRELSTGDAEGARTETIMLLRIDPDTDRIDALRFPRDLLVTRCDGSRGRINAAYGIGERDGGGGAACLVETISQWSGIPIHHVVEIDFRGFVDLVDAVDGVELELEEALQDDRSNLDLPAGCVTVDGPEALAFVRARGMDNDLGRIDRQQQLVAAALDQVATPRTLADPSRLISLVRVAQNHLTFDDQMTTRRLLQLGRVGAQLGGDDLESRTIPGTIDRTEGFYFLQPDELGANQLFRAFLTGDLDRTTDPSEDDEVPEAPGVDGGEPDTDQDDTDGVDGDAAEGPGGDPDDGEGDTGIAVPPAGC